MRAVFAASNTHNSLRVLRELGVFGTSGRLRAADFNNVLHHARPQARYALGAEQPGHGRFAGARVPACPWAKWSSSSACQLQHGDEEPLRPWNAGRLGAVIHIIEPREFVNTTKGPQNMPFASICFEPGSNEGKWLRESGFGTSPLCPLGGDGKRHIRAQPGHETLGDIKRCSTCRCARAQTIDLKVNPPLQVPTAMKDHANARLPGGVSFYDAQGPGAGVRTAYSEHRPAALAARHQDVRERINQCFYTDLFLMVADDQRSGVTPPDRRPKTRKSSSSSARCWSACIMSCSNR